MATMLIGLVLAAQDAGTAAQKKEAGQEASADSPERSIRSFIVAMFTKDVPALRAVTLPVDDLETILPPQPLPPESLDAFKEQIARLPVRRLKAGESVKLAGGRTYETRAEDVGPDRAVVLPEGAAFPLASRLVDGRWRIDVSPIIANTKAAANPEPPASPKTVDLGPIKDKVVIKPGQKIDIQFTREGDSLSAPKVLATLKDKPDAKAEAVRFDFSQKGEDLTLTTHNPFSKNLVFRAAARHKGRKSYIETSIVPVRAGIFSMEMWREPIEELVLFEFRLEGGKP